MPCPTCDHTMNRIGTMQNGGSLWACQRCGTIIGMYFDETVTTVVPKLVERCREFQETLPGSGLDYWRKVGIAESIGN